MKRILSPTDFSPAAENAFAFAVDIASRSGGTVILYHAYTPVESPYVETPENRARFNAQTETELVKKLERLKKKIAGKTGVPVSTILGRTPLIDNILGFAEQQYADMIVMGTQGAGGLKKLVLGSVASRITRKSDIPVLLVPEKYQWKEPSQIVFATDYRETEKKALRFVRDLAKLYDAETTLVHLHETYALQELTEKSRLESYAAALEKELQDPRLKFRLIGAYSVADTIETLDKEIPYDLMVLVRRTKGAAESFLNKSFTRHMAFACKKPLLVIPEQE